VPGDTRWIRLAAKNGALPPALARELAEWILEASNKRTAMATTNAVLAASLEDPSQTLIEARLAILVESLDCNTLEQARPGSLPDDWALFASVCRIATGNPTAARDVWRRALRDPLASDDLLTAIVLEHADTSARFFERFGNDEMFGLE